MPLRLAEFFWDFITFHQLKLNEIIFFFSRVPFNFFTTLSYLFIINSSSDLRSISKDNEICYNCTSIKMVPECIPLALPTSSVFIENHQFSLNRTMLLITQIKTNFVIFKTFLGYSGFDVVKKIK